MSGGRVIVVVLRQPSNRGDMRHDPFFEFGSFGITGCHTNLVKAEVTQGARLAFAQGGRGGFRLVFLTPEVKVVRHEAGQELTWDGSEMPLRFGDAPFLACNDDGRDGSRMSIFISDVNRKSWAAKFSSKFRSRQAPLPPDVAEEVIAAWADASRKHRAEHYEEALPRAPAQPDRDRRGTFDRFRKDAGAKNPGGRCKPGALGPGSSKVKRSC